jgi:hypothetical protein
MTDTETVSLLTVTQWKRRACLPILADMIREQTYSNIVEWVIVEGSPTEEEVRQNRAALEAMTPLPCAIRIVTPPTPVPLGALRQLANEAAIGDVRVVLDDDDYYPPDRVAHAVERLRGSTAQLAGCSPMLTADYATDTVYQWRFIHSRHSVSACMAWKRAYAGTYDPAERVSDEFVFTRGFKTPMVQLDPAKTIVQSSHGGNTYAKKLATLEEAQHVLELQDSLPLHVPLDYCERLRTALTGLTSAC